MRKDITIMTGLSRDQSGRRVTDTDMSGNKRKIIMALAAVSAVIFIFGVRAYFCSGIPLWVVWENGVFTDQTGMYGIELSRKTVQVK